MSRVVQAFRVLRRSPGYAAAAIITLALGIGASTAMFSVIHATLLRPLPYDAERLIRFRDEYVPSGGSGALSIPNFLDLQAGARTVASMSAFDAAAFSVAADERPARATGLRVTHEFFETVGMQPALGRGFAEGEDRAGRADVAVLSYGMWQEAFGGAADVLGRTVLLNARPHTIVGVMPERFWFPNDPQVIVPFAWTADALTQSRGNRSMDGLARLAPGVTPAQAAAELGGIFQQLAEQYPESNQDWRSWTQPFTEFALGANRTSLRLLTGAVLLVLLIGAVNVANLMLVRAERRARDTSVRIALGAGRFEIARQHLAESVLLAAVAATLGIGVAWISVRVLLGLYGDSLPRAGDVSLTLPVLAFAVAIALFVGVLIGLVPSLRAKTDDIYDALRAGGRGGVATGTRLQKSLVAAEVALAVLLVAGAGLLVHSFWKINALDTGVPLDNALVFNLQLPQVAYPTRDETAQFFDRVLPELERLPGVASVGLTDRRPLQGGFNVTTLASPLDPDLKASFVEVRQVTPGYFSAAGLALLGGRAISEEDVQQARGVVVISDALARVIFPDGDAVGARILREWTQDQSGFEVVGVVSSVREFGVRGDPRPAVYWPYQAQWQGNAVVVMVRTTIDPMSVVPAIRRTVAEADPTLPIFNLATMREVMIETTGQSWFAANLFVAFGTIALALAALGIFGVLAYVVEQRTREIGVRVALGATSGNVRRLVVGQGMRVVAVGVTIGLLLTLYASSLLADLLFEVEPADPFTLFVVASVCIGAAALAALLPAVRATRVSPLEALRHE